MFIDRPMLLEGAVVRYNEMTFKGHKYILFHTIDDVFAFIYNVHKPQNFLKYDKINFR